MRTPVTDFVPADLDCTRWENLEPLYAVLMTRPLRCEKCLEKLLLDRSELAAAAGEAEANLYIRQTRFTEDAEAKKAFLDFVEHVEPRIRKASFELAKRIVECEHVSRLDSKRYDVLLRGLKASVELFREENLPLETELTRLGTQYQEVIGAMTVEFDGAERTMPQMGKYQQSLDRDVRERAWRLTGERRLADADRIDEIFDRMLELRERIARNAGFDNFRDYQHRRMLRFDYEPADCERFHRGVEEVCVPLMRRLDAQRAKILGVDPLRPWDTKVDLRGRDPLKPFENGDELVDRSSRAFHRLDPELGRLFDTLREGDCLDLDSRKGKAPGGYQYQRQRTGRPFIFMNSAGLHRDLTTMIHEAGHAFHSLLSVQEPLVDYRDSPIEFAEVASMGMELLAYPELDEFYDGDAADRARREHLEGIVATLPWIAQIDAFQHWIYTHPGHSHAERTAAWIDLDRRFGGGASFEGLEEHRDRQWQRQLHLFVHPFYYIEYGIAQLGALQLWQRSRRDRATAIDGYKRALSLGGSEPLPRLFETAGLRFDFGPETTRSLVADVEEVLAAVPA
ncbi:MAG: M3 family oligoendopeptidase [Phycisphaerales bacterium]